MLKWEIKNNVINKLYFQNNNIIGAWGVETADSDAFFSLEEGAGYRYRIINKQANVEENDYKYQITTQMKEGKWKLEGHDSIHQNSIMRRVEVLCLEDCFFMDFVMRFRFKKKYIEYALINNEKIEYKYSNIYHQYPTDSVKLIGSLFDVDINIKNKIVPPNMKAVMYVRDSNISDEWIIHVRMLPVNYDKIVIKLCSSLFKTKPLPDRVANLILRNEKIKEFLWYHNEREPYKNKILKRVNPNAFPMIKLLKGSKMLWEVETVISKK